MELDKETLSHRLWGEWRNQREDHGAPQTLTTAGSGYLPDDGRTKSKVVLLDSGDEVHLAEADLSWTLLAKLGRRHSHPLESSLWAKREEKPSCPPVAPVPFMGPM